MKQKLIAIAGFIFLVLLVIGNYITFFYFTPIEKWYWVALGNISFGAVIAAALLTLDKKITDSFNSKRMLATVFWFGVINYTVMFQSLFVRFGDDWGWWILSGTVGFVAAIIPILKAMRKDYKRL